MQEKRERKFTWDTSNKALDEQLQFHQYIFLFLKDVFKFLLGQKYIFIRTEIYFH